MTKWFGETSGGVRTYLLEKSAFVASREHYRQILVTPGPEDQIEDRPGVRWYRLRGPRIPSQPQYRFLLATRSLRRIVEHEKPDVIEVGSQLFVPWVTRFAVRRRPTPLVGFYHGNLERNIGAPSDAPDDRDTLRRRVARRYVRIVDSVFNARVAASDGLARDLAAAGVRRVTRVPLGVDLSAFHPSLKSQRDAVRQALGISDASPMVIYVGRIAPEKRLDVPLQAWPQVAGAAGATLVLVGEGPLRERYRELYAHPRIIWHPFQSDRTAVAELLAAADLYIAPGPIETFGLAALEALACGTPVLSVAAGGVAELVARSNAGATYASGDSADLTRVATQLLGSDLGALGQQGRAFAEREHGWERAFQTLFDLYESVAAQ